MNKEVYTLTKAELVEELFGVLGLSRREVKKLVEVFFEQIAQQLATGKNVSLFGFGKFVLIDKAERPGRNPKTGEVVPVTARRVVTFHPGQRLKMMVEANADRGEDAEA